jgi:hypothetical protein
MTVVTVGILGGPVDGRVLTVRCSPDGAPPSVLEMYEVNAYGEWVKREYRLRVDRCDGEIAWFYVYPASGRPADARQVAVVRDVLGDF